jgi:sugar/nucleoside kinase (ribokinase family)
VIVSLGNLSRDLFPGPGGVRERPGGGPFHAARALRHLDVRARIYARCAPADRAALVLATARLGTPVEHVPGVRTASFRILADGPRRAMEVVAVGDAWQPDEVPALPPAARWVHVAPLLRSDFPPATLARLARGRRLALDGQGLVRRPEPGPLRLDADYDPALLAHVAVLKLAEEEAEVLGDPAGLPVAEVIVTRGALGATVHAGGRARDVPAVAVEAEPTGAGDAFAVAYVAARSHGLPPVAAARHATGVVGEVLAETRRAAER